VAKRTGVQAPHDVDRAFGELLQEMRVSQTGGQIFFAFLFSVAFTPVMQRASDGQVRLYVWALVVVVASTAFLVVPVAAHRALFGRRARPSLLVVAHVTTMIGLGLLGLGIVLGMHLIGTVVIPEHPGWLSGTAAALLLVGWLGVPLVLRRVTAADGDDAGARADGEREPQL
jgi:hypothetical protein